MFKPEDFKLLTKQQRQDVRAAMKEIGKAFEMTYLGNDISKSNAFFMTVPDWILYRWVGLIDHDKLMIELKEVPETPGTDAENFIDFQVKLETWLRGFSAECHAIFLSTQLEITTAAFNSELSSDVLTDRVLMLCDTFDVPDFVHDLIAGVLHFASDAILHEDDRMSADDFLALCANYNATAPRTHHSDK